MSCECLEWCFTLIIINAGFVSGIGMVVFAFVFFVKQRNLVGAIFFGMFAFICVGLIFFQCCDFYSDLVLQPWRELLAGMRRHASHGQQNEPRREDIVTVPRMVHTHTRELPSRAGPQVYRTDEIPVYEHQEVLRNGRMECTVCLGDVEKGELVKRLPLCLHLFHKECIDKWLRAHSTCPICRGNVFSQMPPETVLDIEY